MKKLYLIHKLLIISTLLTCPIGFSQDFSKLERFCYPQMTPLVSSSFKMLRSLGVEYAHSSIEIKNEKGLTTQELSVWPQEEISVIHTKITDMRNFESVVLCSPMGYYYDDSNFYRVGDKKIGETFLKRTIGSAPMLYPEECKYLDGFNPFLLNDIVKSYTQPFKKSSFLDQHLLEKRILELKNFFEKSKDKVEEKTFQIGGAVITLNKTGNLLNTVRIESARLSINAINKFSYSKSDNNYKEFAYDKYIDDTYASLAENKSFGFDLIERNKKVYLNLNEQWSKYLYGAPKVAKFIDKSISSINGLSISGKNIENYNTIFDTQKELTIIFENGEEFTFKKIPFEIYYCLSFLIGKEKSDIFWE